MRLPRRLPLRLAALVAPAILVACSSADEGRWGDAPAPRRVSAPAPAAPPVRPRPAAPAGEGVDVRPGSVPSAEDRRTFDEANRMRAEHGLRAFVWSDRLFRAAYDHSAEQARYGYMGHGSPDPARDELADRLRFADCGPLRAWAEVVAMGYDGPATVVDGWMNSRGHRKILLDPNLEEAAFARVGDYFTGDFHTRR
jgi:uncharacterized protein YkwD